MTSATDPKTILLRGNPIQQEASMKDSEAIVPGYLCQIESDGKVSKHSTAGGKANLIAREADYVGNSIDDVFADGDSVPIYSINSGDWFWAYLTTSQTIVKGALLESAANGALKIFASGVPLFRALEAITTTGVIGRIRVEALS